MATKSKRRQASAANRVKAISHPVRAAALRYLNTHGLGSPQEIATAIGEDVSNVSYHVRRLVALECAELVETRPVRGVTEHFYCPTQGHVVEATEWDDLPHETRVSNLTEVAGLTFDDVRVALKAGTMGQDGQFALIHYPMRGVDREGLEELVEICERGYREAQEVLARCLERMEESGEKPKHVSMNLQAFEVPSF